MGILSGWRRRAHRAFKSLDKLRKNTPSEKPKAQPRRPSTTKKVGGYVFRIYEDGSATLRDAPRDTRQEVVPSSIKSVPIRSIGRKAYANRDITSAYLPSPIEVIGESAFQGCETLTDVVLPNSLITIGTSAFAGCTSLERIRIPPTVRNIGIGAFDGCQDALVFEVTRGSHAHKWARRNQRAHSPAGKRFAVFRLSPRPDVNSLPSQRPEELARQDPGATRLVEEVTSTRLSLRMVCRILKTPLPSQYEQLADSPFTSLSASQQSMTSDSLFFLRQGTESLTKKILARRVRMYVSPEPVSGTNGDPLPTLIHPSPMDAYVQVCAWMKERYAATTIAVTGSVGKTTTKEMLALVCDQRFETLRSAGNRNGVTQVGMHVQRLTRETEIYIQETGAGRPGLIERGAQILHPDALVLTNIGLNHVGAYGGSQEAILHDKLSHDRHMADGGVVFANFDDPILRNVAYQSRLISYGIESRDVDFYAENVMSNDGHLEFDVVDAAKNSSTRIVLPAFGSHNVANAVVAFAVARWLGIPDSSAVEALADYHGDGLRQNFTEIAGHRILVDCYNASEGAIASTSDALQTISVPDGARRILVFADIDDKLGDMTEEVHRRVGMRFAEQDGIETIVCFGAHASWSAEEALARGKHVLHTNNRDELHEILADIIRRDDVVAFKGGQQMALSITIDTLFGSDFVLMDGDVLAVRGTGYEMNDVQYRHLREYGTTLRRLLPGFSGHELDVQPSINGHPVYMVGKAACARSDLTTVRIPPPVRTLAQAAFFLARDLKDVDLPDSLRYIGRSAFNGCSSLEELVIPEGVTTIGRRAFYKCTNLRRLVIPDSVKTIEPQAFSYCLQLTIETPEDSFAAQHCHEHWKRRRLLFI